MFLQIIIREGILLLLVIFSFSVSVVAQDGFVFEGARTSEVLSFKKSRGLIILPMYINDKGPFNFILDTGVGSLIITDSKLKDSLNLKYLRKIEIDGLGNSKRLEAYSSPFLKLNIGHAVFKNASAAILTSDSFEFSKYFGMPVHGLLGYDFFNSFIVKINYQTGILKIFSKEKPRLFKNGTKIPLQFIDKKPFILATVTTAKRDKMPLKLLIDSGSGHSLVLESFDDKPFDLPDTFIVANLGVGLSGDINGLKGRVEKLGIGRFTLNNVLASFPYFDDVGVKTNSFGRNGSIGNPLLSRFNVVFDYQKSHVYLKPISNFKSPFNYDKSGLEIVAMGDNFNRFLVSRVEPDSAADEFGMLVGDELLSINFKKVSDMGIEKILETLSSDTGRTLYIELARGEKFVVGVLKLKNRI